LDPDGGGPLLANEFTVSGTITTTGGVPWSGSMFICRIAITAGDSIIGLSGSAPFCNTSAFSASALGAFTSPVLRFSDGATDGGAAALRVCADTDGNPGFTAGDACGAVVYVYFARAGAPGVTPSSIINGAIHASGIGCSTTHYRSDCPGATPASDATLTGTFMIQNLAGAPAPAPLRLIFRIVDSLPPTPSPPYVNVSSVSWTACYVPVNTTTNPPPVDGTDELAVTQTMSFGTTTISRDLWVCGPGNTADPQLTVYWDVNGNGAFEPGLDQQIGPTVILDFLP
jgi:hypothetical protein